MKVVNLFLEDKEHELLTKNKGRLSWHDFVMTLLGQKKEECEKNEEVKEL